MQRLEAGPIVGSDLVQPLHEEWAVDAMLEAWERVVSTSRYLDEAPMHLLGSKRVFLLHPKAIKE